MLEKFNWLMEAIHFFGLEESGSVPSDQLDNNNVMKRQRHFSLEDYSSQDRNQLNSSTFAFGDFKRARQGTHGSTETSNICSNSSPERITMTLEFENDHVAAQLRSELEMHLLVSFNLKKNTSNELD